MVIILQKNKNKQYITLDNSYKLLYTVCVDGDIYHFSFVRYHMNIIVNNTSMQPIYEQIVEQIKGMIMQGVMEQEEMLPSVRSLSKDLRISALTVKKAYDTLEQEGFIVTVHGKGSFVAGVNQNLLLEEQKKEVERDLEAAIRKGRSCGMDNEELHQLFDLLMDDV